MSHDAEVLSSLVGRLKGAADSYRRAGADGPGLSDAFGAAADAHDRTAEQLTEMLRAVGATPSTEADEERHAWSGLPRAVIQGPRATDEAVKQVEAELMAELQRAMDDPQVSGPVRDAVARASDGLKAGRTRVLQALDALEG